jgi:hypothetical protein
MNTQLNHSTTQITVSSKQLEQKDEFEKYGITFLNDSIISIPDTFTIKVKYSGDNTLTTISNKFVRIELNKKSTSYHSYCYSSFYTGEVLDSINDAETKQRTTYKELYEEYYNFRNTNFAPKWSETDCYVVYLYKSELYEADRYYSGCHKPQYYNIEWDKYSFIGYVNIDLITNTELFAELKRLHHAYMKASNQGYQIGYSEIIIRHMPEGHKNLHRNEYRKFISGGGTRVDESIVNPTDIRQKVNLDMKHIRIPL